MESIETSGNTATIDGAILRIQGKAPIISKNGNNPHFKSKFAEYPDIQKVMRPFLIEENILTMFFPVINNQLVMNVKHIVSKEYYKITMDLKTIQDNPQAQGSAITYGKRYMFTAFFDLQIDDASDDDANAASIPGSETQPKGAPANDLPKDKGKEADPNRPWINPNTLLWFDAKLWLFTDPKADMKKVNFKYRITKANQEAMSKQEDLKPGSKYWTFATAYLAKEGNTNIPITKAFNITENDLTDLQIDATNYVAPTEIKQAEINKP